MSGRVSSPKSADRLGSVSTLAIGAFGGALLGVLARLWMRFISENPEFTWNGTLFIIGGFTTFGLAQSLVAIARRRGLRRTPLTVVRAIGGVATLPLFMAAGAVMFPTVVGAGLAIARTEWRRATRGICLLIAVGPVLFVGNDLRDSFGWSLRTVGGSTVRSPLGTGRAKHGQPLEMPASKNKLAAPRVDGAEHCCGR